MRKSEVLKITWQSVALFDTKREDSSTIVPESSLWLLFRGPALLLLAHANKLIDTLFKFINKRQQAMWDLRERIVLMIRVTPSKRLS